MRLNQTFVWKVMTIWISREIWLFNFELLDILCAWIEHLSEMLSRFEFLENYHFSILSLSIYHGPQSYIHVKSFVVWIRQELLCPISIVSINYGPESDFRVKTYDHFNFSRTSIFQFRVPLYIIGLNRTSMSKFMAVWIGPELSCSITSASIYYVPESDIRVKCYDHLNFSRTSIYQFRVPL